MPIILMSYRYSVSALFFSYVETSKGSMNLNFFVLVSSAYTSSSS